MKKMAWLVTLVVAVWFVTWLNDPLNDIVNFIISGTLPHKAVDLGTWSTIGLAICLAYLLYRGYKSVKLDMLEQAANLIKKEEAKKDFEEASGIEFDKSKRSIIAATKSEANNVV